jgi:branched-chain amino acid aminotransferase
MTHTTIEVQRTTTPRPRPSESELGFGKYFADHMLTLEYVAPQGWGEPKVVPYGPFQIDPAAAVLHYGQAIFDGMKGFRQQDGRIALFRLDDHSRRLANGAPRLGIPTLDPAIIRECILALVATDKDWVPSAPATALYVRPVIIATEAFLGVRPAHRYLFYVITSPVGAYYAGGIKPTKIWVETDSVRAVKGGIGAVKAAANYAASLKSGHEAQQRGYDQVLWLDAKEHRYAEEVGTMNLFAVIGDEVITPPLGGTILAGVTRDSILRILRDWGMRVSERPLALGDLLDASKNGTLKEVFGCGTAAVVSAVAELGYTDGRLLINDGAAGPLAEKLYSTITDIQYGRVNDKYGWLTYVS